MTGLTNEQVQQRVEQGQVNTNENPNTRTYKQIIKENTLTFFNFLNLALLVMLLCVGSIKNCTFMGVIVINTIIGIVQEVRAKKVIDKLSILTEAKVTVLRDSKEVIIPTEQLVMDDLIFLKMGDQIPADAKIVEGSLEVNESLLTGEADNLEKRVGDELFSGSFVTAGKAYCQIVHVGKDNYASKITSEAKEFKKHFSELRNSLNIILKVISIIIIPLGALLFYKQYYIVGNNIREAVVNMVAAVLGMIPEGLVLLTSVALTLGALALTRKKTLVQELYCIETLARVDTLCLDKTGTITKGTMCVEDVIPFEEYDEKLVKDIMGNLMHVLDDQNTTANALKEYFKEKNDFKLKQLIPFSSDRKYSGAAFEGIGSYYIGAAQFLFPQGNETLQKLCEEYAQKGFRVLTLAKCQEEQGILNENTLLEPVAIILLTDVVREDAAETLEFFAEQGVGVKVISGDDPATVSAIAKKAGLEGAERYVDASTLNSREELEKAVGEYNIFGRVSPQQKKQMVMALKSQGHTVAMTGDGVNDVLALKEADCGIAMAQGSDAAKNIANIVLLESNFSAMPHIVNQGRRVINNIRTAASMFLIKTIFSVLLALLTIFWGDSYPFEPIQLSIISACAVGIPTFLLAQEHSYEKIDNTFLRHVFLNAFPAAVTITSCVFVIMLVCDEIYKSPAMLTTACVLVTGWNYMATLKTVYSPLNKYRKFIIYSMQVIFFVSTVLLQDLLVLGSLEYGMIILVFLLMTFSPIVIDAITEWLRNRIKKAHKKNKFSKVMKKIAK